MKRYAVLAICFGVLFGLALPALAADAGKAAAPADRPQLTDAQKEQLRTILQAFHADMPALRQAAVAELKKLRELRQSGADQEALKAQIEVVKARIQAIRARVVKLHEDLKAALPPEVVQRVMARIRAVFQEFLNDHPALKERVEARRERARGQAAK